MEEEIWRDIPGYGGRYQVSTFGNVKSMNYANLNRPQVLKPSKTTRGYSFVNLYANGVKRPWFVHVLVATAFLHRPDGKREVDHIDGDPQNNDVHNLRWVTHRENLNNPISLERFRRGSTGKVHSKETREKMSISRMGLAAVPIYQISLDDGRIIREFDGATAAERALGISSRGIYKCLRGKTRQCGGYKWSYKDPNRISKRYIRRNK